MEVSALGRDGLLNIEREGDYLQSLELDESSLVKKLFLELCRSQRLLGKPTDSDTMLIARAKDVLEAQPQDKHCPKEEDNNRGDAPGVPLKVRATRTAEIVSYACPNDRECEEANVPSNTTATEGKSICRTQTKIDEPETAKISVQRFRQTLWEESFKKRN